VISVCIQHHPSRTYLLPRLLDRLEGAELVTDPDPDGPRSPLRCYVECLRRTPPDATQRLVIQDDAWPCENFRERVEVALAERPEQIVAFFVPNIGPAGAKRVREASGRGERWAQIGGKAITPVVATAWPEYLIDDFIAFAESPRITKRYTHDDPVATLFVKSRKLEVWATVPSLAQHLDDVPSLIGKPHGAGKYAHRLAALFAD
jgi:hypothetical protein